MACLLYTSKTLADGFYFVSKTQGIERTLQNVDALHQISAKVGTRTDITVTRWNAYFEEPEDPSEVIHEMCIRDSVLAVPLLTLGQW